MQKLHFLEFDGNSVDNPSAPYAVMPVPYERSTSFNKGTSRAPAAILAASEQIELFDEEMLEPNGLRVQTLSAPDLEVETGEEALDRVKTAAANAIAGGKRFLMSIGGEHTITAPLVEANKALHGDLSVLNLDAHLDLRDSYEGNRLSHACVMRRVMETGVPVTHVGIRSLCREEYELVLAKDIKVFWARALAESRDGSLIDEIIDNLSPRVYVTIDSDCLDPSVMPGTGTPEPGGLSWRRMTELLQRLCAERTVVSADIVEVVPVPGQAVSEYTAARLAAKLMTYHNFCARRAQNQSVARKDDEA